MRNGWTSWDANWVVGSDGPKELCLRRGPDPPREWVILRGEEAARCKASHTVLSCAKRLNRSKCRLGCGLRWAPEACSSGGSRSPVHTWRGNFEGKKGPAQDMRGYVWRLIYSKRLSRGQNRYGADANWSVLDGGEHWRNLANTTEPSVWRRCGLMSSYFIFTHAPFLETSLDVQKRKDISVIPFHKLTVKMVLYTNKRYITPHNSHRLHMHSTAV